MEGIALFAGPGVENASEDGTRFLFRVGVGWEFEIGERLAITPAVELDLIDGEEGVERTAVFGASSSGSRSRGSTASPAASS